MEKVKKYRYFLVSIAVAFAVLIPGDGSSSPTLDDGIEAYGRGEYLIALRIFLNLAKSGNLAAAYNAGMMFDRGIGVDTSYKNALTLYQIAADGGYALAQNNIGALYEFGHGVQMDYVIAYYYYNFAASQGYDKAIRNRNNLQLRMTPHQVEQAQEMGRGDQRQQPIIKRHPKPKQPDVARFLTGSGFIINKHGQVLTNYHVVEGSENIMGKIGGAEVELRITSADKDNDLAVLSSGIKSNEVVPIGIKSVRLGDSIIAVGFPLVGMLSTGLSVTQGTISSLSGMKSDTSHYQITAPIQPGNSGGPLLDVFGNAVGVVDSKLDALKALEATGDIPQNINFAIKGEVVKDYLNKNNIQFAAGDAVDKKDVADIIEKYKNCIVLIVAKHDSQPRPAPQGRSRDTDTINSFETNIRSMLIILKKAFEAGDVNAMTSLYAEQVAFFDKGTVSKEFLATNYAMFFERWPGRKNIAISEPEITIFNNNSAHVALTYKYKRWRNGKPSCSSGIARDEYTMTKFEDSIYITQEKQAIIERDSPPDCILQ